jgi:hypothetical protein
VEERIQFDVALSYAKEDAGIAGDLYRLIAKSGLSVYCYGYQPGIAAGFLRLRLMEIYQASRLNVVLWSKDYSDKGGEEFSLMELDCLVHRHIGKRESKSLLIFVTDGHPLAPSIDIVSAYDIRSTGVLKSARFVIEQIGKISAGVSSFGRTEHPAGTEPYRGPQHPCTFTIAPNYHHDPRGRWSDLADVLVRIEPNPLKTRDVYLIPSGACSPLLRQSDFLRTEKDLLEKKRRATEEFVNQNLGAALPGFWFGMRKTEIEIATVYSSAYDTTLNASLEEPARPVSVKEA